MSRPKPILNLCLLVLILFFSNIAYSQTSVCKLEKNKLCVGFGYLRDKSIELFDDVDYDYKDNFIRVGVDYGFTENIKISLLPDFKVQTGSENYSGIVIPPSVGLQIMRVSNISPTTSISSNTSRTALNYFFIFSVSPRYLKPNKDPNADYIFSTELIGGGGLALEYKMLSQLSLTAFFDAYYENKWVTGPELTLTGDMGLEAGLEINFPGNIIFIAKWNRAIMNPENLFHVSLSIKPWL